MKKGAQQNALHGTLQKSARQDSGAQQEVPKLDWQKSSLIPAIVQDATSKEVLMLAFMDKEAFALTLQTRQMHYFSRSKGRIWKKGETSGHIQRVKSAFVDCDNDALLFLVEQVGAACHTGNKSCFFQSIGEVDSGVNLGAKTAGAESASQKSKIVESKKAESEGAESKNYATHLDSANSVDSTTLATPVPKPNSAFAYDIYGVIDTLYHTLLERKFAKGDTSYTASLYEKGVNTFGKKIIEEAGEVVLALKDADRAQIVYECADLVYHVMVGLAYNNIHPEQISQELARRFGLSGIDEKAQRKANKA
nr:phosphoribosyl-AMP cyclohydrolase [Helicobacter sp. CLO-3]